MNNIDFISKSKRRNYDRTLKMTNTNQNLRPEQVQKTGCNNEKLIE